MTSSPRDPLKQASALQNLIDDPGQAEAWTANGAPVDADPEARELAEDIAAFAPALQALGREIVTPVPAALRSRVREMAQAALARPTPRWRAAVQALWTPAGKFALAGAMACALLVAVVIHQRAGAPIGRLDFTASHVTIDGQARTGHSHAALRPGARLATDAQSAGLVSLGEGTRMALDRGTVVEVITDDLIRLDQGRIFLRAHEECDIVVTLPSGATVRDIGTIFGVDLTAGAPIVEVADGLVEVTTDGAVAQVRAGEALTLTAGTLVPLPRSAGLELPGWVSEILTEEQQAHVEQFVPSARGL